MSEFSFSLKACYMYTSVVPGPFHVIYFCMAKENTCMRFACAWVGRSSLAGSRLSSRIRLQTKPFIWNSDSNWITVVSDLIGTFTCTVYMHTDIIMRCYRWLSTVIVHACTCTCTRTCTSYADWFSQWFAKCKHNH